MYSFGKKSKEQYNTLHSDLQAILDEVIKYYDFSVLEGLRTKERQQYLFKQKRSKLDGIRKRSKHQGKMDNDAKIVSYAVDLMPYKKGTNAFSEKIKDNYRFYYLMGMIRSTSEVLFSLGIISHKVRFGIDWDSDDVFTDQNFDDMPHLELIKG